MAQNFAQKTNRAFYQTVLTVVAALVLGVLATFKVYQISSLYMAVLIHKIKDACGCESMAQFFTMHPDIFRAVILFAIGISVFILYSLHKLHKLNLSTKKYIAQYMSFAKVRHSAKLEASIKTLGLDSARVIEIESCEPVVFCFGYLSPKICISSVLSDMLSAEELQAVLSHEAQHMITYEPLKVFIVKYFRSIFFFLPGLKTFARKYITLSELAADEKASGGEAERSSLASAILKISEQEEYLRPESGAPLFYFSPAIEERANRLCDESYVPKFKFLDRSLILGSLGLAIASLIFIFVFSSSTKAFEMHNISGCVTPVAPQSDPTCATIENSQNILNSNSLDFQNMNSINLDQHSACEAK